MQQPAISLETRQITILKQQLKRQDAMIEKLQKEAAGVGHPGAPPVTSADMAQALRHPVHTDIMGRAIAPEDLVVYYDYKTHIAVGRISKITPKKVRVARCDKEGKVVQSAIPLGPRSHALKWPDEIYIIQQRNKP